MKTMKNWLLTGLLFMIVSTVFSQGKVSGTITDDAGATLPGANVAVKGSTNGTSTDFDGKFTIDVKTSTGELVITYLGYDSKTLKFSVLNGATTNLGAIVLESNSNELSEIVVKSTVVDIAKDRKTPVAVSTIKAAEIQEKLGTQEFPEILRNTPSVYVTKSGGGFGDSRINIRGFDQKNIAVMINGMPVNDMENGSVFWSNWAGLSDVTSAMQVQRGLGSSKLATPSVGGTINIVTRSSDKKEGGSFSSGFGNGRNFKVQGSYNTGKLANGLSASVLLSQTMGDGYINGTQFEGTNYFIALGYATKNNKHDFQFTLTGAPQSHSQRSTVSTIATYQKYGSLSDPNIRYNADAGYLNGEEYNIRKNYYHKPVASFNWDYKINETTKLSTVLYASMGRGAGAGATGGVGGLIYNSPAFLLPNGMVDYDKIQAWNSGQGTVNFNGANQTRTQIGGVYQNSSSTGRTGTSAANYVYNTTSGISQTSSINSHDWFGAVINLNKKLTESLTLDFGLDARTYTGYHFTVVNDLLGGGEFYDNNIASLKPAGRHLTSTYPTEVQWNVFDKKSYDKISFNSTGKVKWLGLFTQLEYSKDNLTVFVQGAASQQGFKREDDFVYLPTDKLASTSYKNIFGGNVKGGANYNINEKNNVYVNAGYYSRQPFFNSVYPNNRSIVNPNLTNEKITGFEAGYGFRSRLFNATVNVYNTTWNDRYLKGNALPSDNTTYTEYLGLNEVHSGIEIEANSNITEKLKVNAMFSYGIWEYKGNATVNAYFQADNSPVTGFTDVPVYMDKVKVGDAAQMTASLGASYEVLTRVTIDANYNFNDKLYAGISPTNFSSPTNKGALELPSYGLVDAGFSYKMLTGKNKDKSVNFRLNVNNLFDKIYIAESRTNIFASDNVTSNAAAGTYASNNRLYKGIADGNQVFFGFGRTWNFTLRYDF
ncbi:TonB-dependent receptor [Flavobacterium sp. FlaQc-52]|jgi:outer membrane receptor protein involved in Fe transport|uniref:TonB-dependent receptor n=1 Tax=Flavobacterium cupriresistens TaxID=2893885 RepID=A0ABU4RGX8_9FLAO|nr:MULTISPECIES: TonB-dependent receptor [unclassified Flavobacterium]MDX6191531.1 TonB-dependent receptor [Flavobacterium sp. Fl-318]UFH43295.1 TonB-dependent receptor [Flavobacterium sp. F-323]